MKVLLVNSNHTSGGAARAVCRLHSGLRKMNIDSTVRVQNKTGKDKTIRGATGALPRLVSRLRVLLDQLPVMLYRSRTDAVFAPAWVPDRTWRKINSDRADIVNLHWITKSFLRVENLSRIDKPIVWTLHDMWAFTGGCHYDGGCGKYRASCGGCPTLNSTVDNDLSSRNFMRKLKTYKDLQLTIVTPSHWLARCVRDSSLLGRFRVEVIPNGLDLALYRRVDPMRARDSLGLPRDRKIILFGAMGATENKRKGFGYLCEALQIYAAGGGCDKSMAVVFGSSGESAQAYTGLPIRYLGNLDDEDKLVMAYSAADVFLAPSIQENLSNSVLESLACGTPCVAFDIGGMPEMIDHGKNGYLAEVGSAGDLANGISWVLEDGERWETISGNARKKVEQEFELSQSAARYKALYQDILVRR